MKFACDQTGDGKRNTEILAINELKWQKMGESNLDSRQESFSGNGASLSNH